MKTKLPKTLYVRREPDGSESYLVAEENLREQLSVDETRIIGQYRLVSKYELSAELKTSTKCVQA